MGILVNLLWFFLVAFCQHGRAQDIDVVVDLFLDAGCSGDYYSMEMLRDQCGTFEDNTGITGIDLLYGSCFLGFDDDQCDGNSALMAWPNNPQICELDDEWNDRINSIEACGVIRADGQCPEGTWGRVLKVPHNDLRDGITVQCYEPGLKEYSYEFNTHGKETVGSISSCDGAARGIYYEYDETWNIITDVSSKCDFSEEQPEFTVQCDETDAVAGIFADVENYSEAVKSFGVWCANVPDPSQLCMPTEDLALVLACDNLDGSTDFDCSYKETTGVGLSTASTETERAELTFYEKFGMSIGTTYLGLAPSFSAEIGASQLVGYEWSQTDSATWHTEREISASFTAPPHTLSTLEQLTGKCSFYGVQVNYFKKTDTPLNSNVSTVSYWKLSDDVDETGLRTFIQVDDTDTRSHAKKKSNPGYGVKQGQNKVLTKAPYMKQVQLGNHRNTTASRKSTHKPSAQNVKYSHKPETVGKSPILLKSKKY